MSQSVRRLRLRIASASAAGNCIEHQYGHGERKPLECVAVMFVDAEIRRLPVAYETVLRRTFFTDHERLNRNRAGAAIALDREVLPHRTLHDVRGELERAKARHH